MKRSAVLSGLYDARDRARQRRRGDRGPAPRQDPFEALWRWLRARTFEDESFAAYDLNAYLRETASFGIAAEERLRQLAMHVETTMATYAPHALERVYEAGLRFAPDDPLLWHSRSISARCAARVGHDAFAARALEYAERAWNLTQNAKEPGVGRSRRGSRANTTPSNTASSNTASSNTSGQGAQCFRQVEVGETCEEEAAIAHTIGMWHYELGKDEARALRWFERAVKRAPNHGNAHLFLAHCLHDLERFPEAVLAYDAVPLDAFDGPRAWIVDVVLEARAYCRMGAGDQEGALREFRQLIARLNREPSRAAPLQLLWLRAAVEGELNDELAELAAGVLRLV